MRQTAPSLFIGSAGMRGFAKNGVFPSRARASRAAARAIFCIVACVVTGASVAADAWKALPVAWSVASDPDGAWHLGEGPNPVGTLPIDAVRGRWVRFSGIGSPASSGISFRINVRREGGRVDYSIPALCGASLAQASCTTLVWVPFDATEAKGVVWADRAASDVRSLRVEVATVEGSGAPVADRARPVVDLLKDRYYRSAEVDWPALEREVAAIPRPPDDVDPVASVAQYLRMRLPGNKHMFVWLATTTQTSEATATTPVCDVSQADHAVVALPGLTAITGAAPNAYAAAIDRCLMSRDAATAWVVDLRANSGGNMYPMIGGLAPLLSIGDLYAFVDGRGQPTARLTIDARGIAVNGVATGAATPDIGRRTQAPVVVIFDGRCGSSCEQTANALSTRARTLFVGAPSAGYLTANAPHAIDARYTLLVTEGYTADPCGRPIADNLQPDVPIDHVDRRSIADVLAVEAVASWLRDTRSRIGEPVSAAERAARCGRAPA